MNELELARQDINEIDERIAELFVRRMEASARVLSYKRDNGMPIFDPEREGQVIENGLRRIENGAYRGYYRQLIQLLMDISKDYQRTLLEEHREI